MIPGTSPSGEIEVSVLSGSTDRPGPTFVPGVPMNPISIGARADWIVRAQGVGDIHVLLAFNGTDIFVAAGPQQQALLSGAPLRTDWTRATLPCEVRFGGACLILRTKARQSAPPRADDGVPTNDDGGALFRAAQRAVQAAGRLGMDAGDRDGSPKRPGFGGRPAGGPPGGGGTVILGDQSPNTARLAHPTGAAAGRPVPAQPPVVDGVVPGKGAGSDRPGANEPPTLGADLSRAEDDAVPAKRANFWKEASPAKKAIVALMPLVLVGSYFLMRDEPGAHAPPTVIPSKASASATRQVLDGGTPLPSAGAWNGPATLSGTGFNPISGQPAATASGIAPGSSTRPAAGNAKSAPGGSNKRSPEREALDLAADGLYEEAATRYEALASVHPEDPTFKEAARILRVRAGHAH